MSIEREGSFYFLYCDVCGYPADEQFDEFMDAVEFKKREGWKSRKDEDGNWEDICPECLELEATT